MFANWYNIVIDNAMVLELVDKHGLEPCAARHVGSTPTHGTIKNPAFYE